MRVAAGLGRRETTLSLLRHVIFTHGDLAMAGDLHVPAGFNEDATYAAIVIATPGSSVKDQVGGIYAARLADEGFVALTFDPSHQGESEGEPRDLEDPAARVEDLRCAFDYLTTLSFIDSERLGLFGICAGGGYAVNAAMTEHRAKAVGVVAPINIGRAFRQAQTLPDVLATLTLVGVQRTIEASGGAVRRDPWIPDSLEEALIAGVADADVLDAVIFYRESSYARATSSNRLLFRSYGPLLTFDAFHLVEELLTQPLQVIVGGRRGSTGSYEDGEALVRRAPEAEALCVIAGAGHYDMYHRPGYVRQAVSRLTAFFNAHLAPINR